MKPFKPPMLAGRPASQAGSRAGEPPAKRRRISQDDDEEQANVEATKAAASLLKIPAPKKFVAPVLRKPLEAKSANGVAHSEAKLENRAYYTVLWRKFTMKKNKTWDGDGVLVVHGTSATLQDISGRELGRGVCKGPLLVGSGLSIGGKDVEVDAMIPRDDYVSGRVFLGNAKKIDSGSMPQQSAETSRVTKKERARYDRIAVKQRDVPASSVSVGAAGKSAFKTPVLNNTVQVQRNNSKAPTPRHDPIAPGALVMKRPRSVPRGRQIVDVVVDPLLTKSLRKHQREGVAFLYECVMGMKDHEGEGALLADEMGLGKTLQTIALLWTLLKQNPIYEDAPVVKKALIVCPVTLIGNWRKEIRKWLGEQRIGVFVPDSNKVRLTDFTRGRAYQVMIIGYEKLTKVADQLQGDCGIDIIIADEGHRLKTAKNKAAAAIKSINTERRVILSGTPIQNDLEEFFVMVDFVNPSVLSKYSTFKREFETPILKGQQVGATAEDVEKGEARGKELAELTGRFVLRRTAEILSKYLPPKTEHVVFCKPTEAQASVYRAVVESQAFMTAMSSPAAVLELINVLKKVCNCPTLLKKKNDKGEEITKPDLIADVPAHLLKHRGASGKLQLLDSLLHHIEKETEEKVVLVSNYTSTMDILGQLLTSMNYKYIRLDGSTPNNKRQDLVDRFNRSPRSNSFIFLLSAKAGGTGINLIGASRLILFDLDWNPATCLQTMARIHRDGQKRPCFIYRLLTQGALDEKIFQRQVSKMGLSDNVVDGKSTASSFTQAELRDLFTLDESDTCQTHHLLGCDCGGVGSRGAVGDDTEEDTGASRSDLADLSREMEDGVEVVRLDGEEVDTVAKNSATMRAIRKLEAQEAEYQRKNHEARKAAGHTKMLGLMQYSHFDTSRIGEKKVAVGIEEDDGLEEMGMVPTEVDVLDRAIEDTVLCKVLREPERRVGFVMTKSSSVRLEEEEE